jgi:uncharacterized integral membrane protein
MVRKIVSAIILVPLLFLIVGFAVANRQLVRISFDPFDQSHPAASVTLPLFIMLFVFVIVGVLVGGIASWMRQGPWRRAARRLDAEVRALHTELETMRRQPSPPSATSVPAVDPARSPHPALPPAP